LQSKFLKLFVILAILIIISFPSSIRAQSSNQSKNIQNETKITPPVVQNDKANLTIQSAELGVNSSVRTYLYNFTDQSKLPSFTSERQPQVVAELNETLESGIRGIPETPITREIDVKDLKISPETEIANTDGIKNVSKFSSFLEASARLFRTSISLNSDLPYLRQIQITTPSPISNLPVTNIPANRMSTTLEPSVANNGRTVFYTGNWFAARSTDGGQSWTHVDVFRDMPTFCCDQEVIFSPNKGIFIWARQDGSGFIRLGISTDAINWRFYDFRPTDINGAYIPTNPRWTPWFDRPRLALSNMHVFVTAPVYMGLGDGMTNVYQGSVIIRFNLDQLRDGILTGNNLPRPHVRGDASLSKFVPVQGATNNMHWGLPLTNHNMRIYSWADDTMGYWWIDREIPAYLPSGRGTMSCPGPDGINWCYEIKDRSTDGGWIREGIIGFYWNVQQDPLWLQSLKRAFNIPPFPFPYVQEVTFREDQLATSIGGGQIWNSDYAIVQPSIAPTSRGLGIAAFIGGGAFYPSLVVGRGLLASLGSFGTIQLWTLNPVVMGTNAPPPQIDQSMNLVRDSNGNTVTRWGDYLTVRPFAGAGPLWIASGFVLQGGNAGQNVRPMYVIFGLQ
jgi:hypothetical protein